MRTGLGQYSAKAAVPANENGQSEHREPPHNREPIRSFTTIVVPLRYVLTTLRFYILLIACLFCFKTGHAQHYINSFGIRVSEDLGLTFQQRVAKFVTIEAIMQSSRYRYYGTVLGEWHHRLLTRRLNFYLGGGGHWGSEERYGEFYGFTPVVGLELNIARLNISADYKPAFNIKGDPLLIHSSGISVRYILFRHHGWRPGEKVKEWWKSDKNFFKRKKKKD